jgi:pimeloyl-ACP methyl ester carboxylesterase
LLERLVAAWPEPVEELAIVGHSMGGLVARSALHYGSLEGQAWRRQLRHLVFLGTPHHGSRLERAGSWASLLMGLTPYSAPFQRLGASRSAGITDLRHGSVLDEDWQGPEWSGRRLADRQPASLPTDIRCYAVGVTLGMRAGDAKDRVLGDGLVPLKSALGIHRDPQRHLAFPHERRWVGHGMSHLDLLRRPEVYEQLREWLGT